jgi:hypothetical protein
MAHKKILATLMAMVMATSIAACSKTDTEGSADTSAAADPAVESDQGQGRRRLLVSPSYHHPTSTILALCYIMMLYGRR